MSFIESGIIRRSEYEASVDQRLSENTFIIDELYTGMFALAKNRRRAEAVKVPVRVKDSQRTATGLYIATLGLFDLDLKERLSCKARFNNGYWEDVSEHLTLFGVHPQQAYLKSYETPFDDELVEIATSIDLVDKELVLV